MDDSVGSRLREARTRRQLSLAEVEEAIKIRPRYLQAIEDEEWDHLPGDTYARAFIRTYGRFLGLDGERLAEEQRRMRGADRPGERLPRVDPRPRPVPRKKGGRGGSTSIPPRFMVAAVTASVVVALLVVGLSTGGSSDKGAGPHERNAKAQAGAKGNQRHRGRKAPPAGHSLQLAAKAEVWVCLLDGKGKPLVNGLILDAGKSAGPFRSGSFTLALGNGAVTMTVDGQQANLPEPSSPIGFTVAPDGKVHELPEGERPTCA